MTPLCNSDIFCTSFTAESTMREERREKRSWKEKRDEKGKKERMKRSINKKINELEKSFIVRHVKSHNIVDWFITSHHSI